MDESPREHSPVTLRWVIVGLVVFWVGIVFLLKECAK